MEIDGRQVADDGYDWFLRRFKGIEAGDVFSFSLPSGGFAFGRVMNAHDGAQIAEYFRHWQEDDAFSDGIVLSGRLFAPIGVWISGIAYRNRKRPWKVIHKDPEYYPDELYDIQFLAASGYRGAYQYYTLRDIGKFYGAISKEELDNELVCSIMPQHPGMIANLVEKHMRASGLMGRESD